MRLLPPGFRLTEDGPEQYYFMASHRSVPNPEVVRSLIDHAVKKRLMADVEVGTFLSGGLDSSIITAVARRHKPDLRAFTVGMAGTPDVEVPMVNPIEERSDQARQAAPTTLLQALQMRKYWGKLVGTVAG